jgi:hypothetical protein
MWEGFSAGHLHFELNCAGVYSKYLGMPKLFEYPIKSYLKNLTSWEMP